MLPQVCKDLSLFCNKNSAAGVRARQLCPLTCGCHDPFAPLALSLPGSGCGDQCMRTGAYLDALAGMPCRDNNTALLQLCDNLDQVKESFPRDWRLGVSAIVTDLRRYGCDYLAFGTDRLPPNSTVVFQPHVGGMNLCTRYA